VLGWAGRSFHHNRRNHGPIASKCLARSGANRRFPTLIIYSEKWLFGEIWERPGLKKRDRQPDRRRDPDALGRERQLVGHLNRALDNGVTKQEISESSPISPSYSRLARRDDRPPPFAKDVFEKR